MKRVILAVGIAALFIGVSSFSAGTSVKTLEPREDGPGWSYVLFGSIRSYELVEYDGEEYLECRALHVVSFWLNVLRNLPNLPLRMTLRLGQKFNIPYEGAEIIGPTKLGNYFIMAQGTL